MRPGHVYCWTDLPTAGLGLLRTLARSRGLRKVSQSLVHKARQVRFRHGEGEEEVSTAAQNAGADDADALARYTGPPVPAPRPQGHFLVRF